MQLVKMRRRQYATDMLRRKENIKCFSMNTRSAKNRQVLYSYEKLYSRFIDRNFSVNSKKNLLHSCDTAIVAKCGVENQQLKSSSERKISSVPIFKKEIYKKLQVLHSYKKLYSKYNNCNFSVNSCEKKFFKIFACDSRQQQVKFHAKYPLFDSRSDLEFTLLCDRNKRSVVQIFE